MNPPVAFTMPHPRRKGRVVLWVTSPSGTFMLLGGSWGFIETARLFAVRCGYKLIATDVGMAIVEQQMNQRADDQSVRALPTVH